MSVLVTANSWKTALSRASTKILRCYVSKLQRLNNKINIQFWNQYQFRPGRILLFCLHRFDHLLPTLSLTDATSLFKNKAENKSDLATFLPNPSAIVLASSCMLYTPYSKWRQFQSYCVYTYDDSFQVKAFMNSTDAFARLKEPALLKQLCPFVLDHYTFCGNYPPTSSLSAH